MNVNVKILQIELVLVLIVNQVKLKDYIVDLFTSIRFFMIFFKANNKKRLKDIKMHRSL